MIKLPKSSRAGQAAFSTWRQSLAETDRDLLEAALTRAPDAEGVITAFAEHAPFLFRLAKADARRLAAFIDHSQQEIQSLTGEMRRLDHPGDFATLMTPMRRLRSAFALALALCDCRGASVDDTMLQLSGFADAAVEAATRIALKDLALAGRLEPPADPDWISRAGLFVLALGKHGARELNYSSDIDLAVFYEPDAVPIAEGREIQPVMVAVTQRIVKLLSEVTPAGYVFRTDLRLRPDPGSNAIAMPVGAALRYYEALGQNWERAAMIKARPVAGDFAAGEAFLAELRPFIWRKYFDYAAIADIHAMKRQINAHKGFGAIEVEGHDVKLGRGGIREIEFFVQTQQLVYGGRRPGLRGPRTLEMLGALRDEGWITAEAARELSQCYRCCAPSSIGCRCSMTSRRSVCHRTKRPLTALPPFAGKPPRPSTNCCFRPSRPSPATMPGCSKRVMISPPRQPRLHRRRS